MSATIEDVRDILDTHVQDQDIQPIIDRVSREIDREYSPDDFQSETHRVDLVSAMAALRIVSSFDRRASSVKLGNASKTYDTSLVDYFRGLVRRYDPGDSLSVGGVRRDSDRNVASANNGGLRP